MCPRETAEDVLTYSKILYQHLFVVTEVNRDISHYRSPASEPISELGDSNFEVESQLWATTLFGSSYGRLFN
jgi:hypothetical protein